MKKLSFLPYRYIKILYRIFHISVHDTIKQDGIEHAGYLAFLSILSLFPFLIFLVATIGFIGGSDLGRDFIVFLLQSIPQEASSALQPRIEEILSDPPQSFLTLAIIGVIWTASSSVEGLRTILNRAYRVFAPPPYILRRLISIVEFFIITASVMLATLFLVFVPSIVRFFEKYFSTKLGIDYEILNLNHTLIFLLLILGTSLLYYALPNVQQKYRQTLPGAFLTVSLWILIKNAFVLYLDNFNQFNFVYGSLAGIMISLIFFYLINLAFIFGAEFNYHLHRVFSNLKNR